MDYNYAFGKKVRELRLAKDMTQRELAEAIDINFTYLSKIETGKVSPPSVDTILEIAKVLGADIDELLVLARKAPKDLIARAISNRPQVLKYLRRAAKGRSGRVGMRSKRKAGA